MTTTPAGNQPQDRAPGDPARPGGPAQPPRRGGPAPAGRPELAWEPGVPLSAAQIAELNRLDGDPDPDDPQCWQDPETGAPGWWEALAPAEQARQVNESIDRPAAEVAESIAAGFTHGIGGSGSGFESGGSLDVMLPGAGLAAQVGRVRRGGLDGLSDDALIGVLQAAARLECWAAGLKADAVSELDARRAGPDGREGEHVAPEVGKALTLTPRSAQVLLEQVRGLERFPALAALLRAGIIDSRKAALITGRLELLPGGLAARVLEQVLPRAGQLTTGELRARLEHAIKAADPQAAIKRRQKAQQDARVEVWTEDAGTAAIAGRDLDPADVIAADQQLTADAQWLKAHGVAGTQDRLRALACTARLAGQPLTSLLPPAPSSASASGLANGAGQPGGLGGSVNLTIPAGTWLGLTDRPGDAASYGPIDAATCRDLAQRLAAGPATTWCLTLVDDQGRAAGHGCAKTTPPATSPPGNRPPGNRPPGNRPPGTGPPGAGPPGSISDQIAWLASIPITHIATGSCEHQRESPGYRPPESLRHLIKIRSPRCGEPGCRTPARRADDDHTIPYHLGGKTCECNLHPECRRSHRTKQSPGWHVTQPEPGLLIWTTPSGRSYTNITEPLPV